MYPQEELKNALKETVFADQAIQSPGEVFQTLCESFPLQKISQQNQHRAALEVLEKTSLFLKRNKLSKEQENQILNYLDSLGVLVENYEEEHILMELRDVPGHQVLKYLMEQHGLKQRDLEKELGGQAAVSSILSGKRKLNTRQMTALSSRFGVNPTVFF